MATSDSAFKLLRQKGIYPYEYIKGYETFAETQLPPKEAFFSKLTNQGITDKEYEHAQQVFSFFNCQNLEDYHKLYLWTDVYLLADIFEAFRKTAFEQYRIDPAHYVSAPAFSWDALLLSKWDSELGGSPAWYIELLTDSDMYNFVDCAKRGGISTCINRLAQANNPYLPEFNPTEPTTYIGYLDANNLYGWAMSQDLPTRDFRWATADERMRQTVNKDYSKPGFYEVDIFIPHELHDYFSDFCPFPENVYCPDLRQTERRRW
jgi:hypothetical protein